MCGISGIITKESISEGTRRLKLMTDAIAHRGPDGEGSWSSNNGRVHLGHRRLSIIDLTECGSQPMHYLNRYTIVFNGEIYNYVELKRELTAIGCSFHSDSDTEVLLALYHEEKENCLSRLDGMFAFAIYDAETDVLFCARDRFGEKPFFYQYEEGRHFYFGSEMKALWAGGIARSVNEKMLFNYLHLGLVQNPLDSSETFFRNIFRLKPGHYLKISGTDCRIRETKQYWSLQQISVKPTKEQDAIEEFRQLFITSVERRLRSDVPVGSSLSGGLDSSLVVMIIDAIKGKAQVQKTFSARFPGYGRDEGVYMEKVIDRCRVEAHFAYPKDDAIINKIEKVFFHQEEPFGSASIYAQFEVMELARRNGVVVLLDGQGADEILAGYHSYFPSYFNELKTQNRAQYEKEKKEYELLHQDNTINPVIKSGIRQQVMQYARSPFLKRMRTGLMQATRPEWNPHFYSTYAREAFRLPQTFSSLNENLKWNTGQFGLEQLLRYADRNSMAHSLEVRLPFLSHELVEFVFSLESTYKIRSGWTKWLMRETFKDLLPQEITWRKDKIGYEPPQQQWLRRKEVMDLIQEKKRMLVKAGIVHQNVLNHQPEGRNSASKAWTYWMAGSLISAE